MKKIMILAFLMLINSNLFCQNKSDSIAKTKMILSIDSVQNMKIENLNKKLTGYYNSNRKSQFFFGTAIVFGGLSYLLPPIQQQGEKYKPLDGFGILAIASAIIGTKIYFESFNILNINPKPKKKVIHK